LELDGPIIKTLFLVDWYLRAKNVQEQLLINEHNNKLIFALTTKKTKGTTFPSYIRASDVMFKSVGKDERYSLYGNTHILVVEMTETASRISSNLVSKNISVCRILILTGVCMLRKNLYDKLNDK